jgi:hypothetical protein
MNCRPFVVIAVMLGGLVPAAQPASAELPTRRTATATATILSPVSTRDLARRNADKNDRKVHMLGTIMTKFVDENGFITNTPIPQSHKIFIVDLP